jgi:hypothetical protein
MPGAHRTPCWSNNPARQTHASHAPCQYAHADVFVPPGADPSDPASAPRAARTVLDGLRGLLLAAACGDLEGGDDEDEGEGGGYAEDDYLGEPMGLEAVLVIYEAAPGGGAASPAADDGSGPPWAPARGGGARARAAAPTALRARVLKAGADEERLICGRAPTVRAMKLAGREWMADLIMAHTQPEEAAVELVERDGALL